ncbi:MAG: NAD(P)/FAD-dependent oxidoreductase [Polyangiales bacterium]
MRADALQGDVVIVGGGPAGLTTAIALVERVPRLRARLVVLERDAYPREKVCAGAVSGMGEALLAALDVRVDVPAEVMHGHAVRSPRGLSVARPGRVARVVRREQYDAALADVARARGVRVETSCAVRGVGPPAADGTVAVETARGALRACAVVGADGVGSAVRRTIGARPGGLRAQVVEVDTEPVAGDVPRDLLHFDTSDPGLHGYAWDFATRVDGEALVCRGVYRLLREGERAGDGADVRDRLDARLAAIGLDPSRYRRKRFAERGFSPRDVLATERVMLVGEAAGVDPFSGEGIGPAIEYGVLAAGFLAEHLGGTLLGWTSRVRRSRLALDLRARGALVAPYYDGPLRAAIDGALARSPAPLEALGDLFGGRRPRLRTVARAGAASLAALASSALARR